MSDQNQFRIVRIPRWAVLAAGIAAIAFGIALLLLSVTVFLILLPVAAVAGGLYYLFGGRRKESPGAGRADIIEGEYRIIDSDGTERDRR